MSCGVGSRHSLDLALLWLWHSLGAIAPIGSLAWEPPYTMGEALKRTKRQKKKLVSSHYFSPDLISDIS